MTINLAESLEIVARTDAGRVRSHNEDSVYADSPLGLAIVADGMGGYNAGEVASGLATMMLRTELGKAFGGRSPEERMPGGELWMHQALKGEIARANSAILQAAQTQARYTGMGTTLVTALFHDNKVTVAHIGDSRLYRLRGGELAPLTRDHSLLQEQLDGGIITPEQARLSKNRNLVTRALGIDPAVEAEIRDHEVQAGDIYLLCSDGLNDMIEDEEIASCLTTLSANLELCATRLVDMANDNGGRDNVSVVLVRIKRAFPAARGWWARLLAWFR
jgi:PPM family protein phosphatase